MVQVGWEKDISVARRIRQIPDSLKVIADEIRCEWCRNRKFIVDSVGSTDRSEKSLGGVDTGAFGCGMIDASEPCADA
jgi:hypothetical protein